MDTMAERLKHALAVRQMTPADLVRAKVLSKAGIYFILDGTSKAENIRSVTMAKLSKALAVNRDWLLTGRGSMDEAPEQRFTQGSFATSGATPSDPSQFQQLDPETIRDAHELIRGSYQDGGKVYDIEAEPDLFATVYAKLLAIKGRNTLANVAPIVRDIDRFRAEGEDHGTGRDERAGGAAKASGKKRASS